MAGLQVLSAPTNQPTITGVTNAPAGLSAAPLKVAALATPQPAKLPVVSQPANVQPKLSVQPLPAQPNIYVPPKPPQMDKIASDIGVARGRGADDETILRALLQKTPTLVPDVKTAIKERGATPSQVLDAIIAKHAQQPEQKQERSSFQTFTDPTVGILKSFAKTGQTFLKPLDALYEKITGSKPTFGALSDEELKPVNTAQKIGKVAGDIAQTVVASEATAPLVAGVEATTAKTALPAVSKALINTFGRSVIEGGTAYGVSKLQGASKEEAATNALIAGAIPWAGAALKSLKAPAQQAANKIETSIIKPTQADIKDGFKTQNIFKYDLGGTLQHTAQKTSDRITELSAQLNAATKGSNAKIDVLDLLAGVEKDLKVNKTKTFGANSKMSNALNFFTNELADISDNGIVDLSEAQQMKRAVGKLGAWYYGARDPEANAIETVANQLYTKLRLTIEKTAPKEVAGINKELSELIPIENAIIRRVPIAERGNVFGLSDIVTALPAVENLRNPANWWLFAINKLSKSGRVANVLNKASREPEVRGPLGLAAFGTGSKQLKDVAPLEPNFGLSTKTVGYPQTVKPATLKYFKANPTKPVKINRYTPGDPGARKYPSYLVRSKKP